jgi:hypothetical protein
MARPRNTVPRYSDAEWPLFVAWMPSTSLSQEAFEAHLEALREPYRRGQPFGIIIVMGDHPPLPASQRKAAAEGMKLDWERLPRLLRAKAVVATSDVERGVVTAVGWMGKPNYPFASFETLPEAKTWLLGHLRGGRAAGR